ncbi:hypothetical protein B7463_g12713, partial [Scytalidium lignicola]
MCVDSKDQWQTIWYTQARWQYLKAREEVKGDSTAWYKLEAYRSTCKVESCGRIYELGETCGGAYKGVSKPGEICGGAYGPGRAYGSGSAYKPKRPYRGVYGAYKAYKLGRAYGPWIAYSSRSAYSSASTYKPGDYRPGRPYRPGRSKNGVLWLLSYETNFKLWAFLDLLNLSSYKGSSSKALTGLGGNSRGKGAHTTSKRLD